MADLSVQPKKQTSIIPWILLLLGIAALVWWLFFRNKDHQVAMAPAATDTVRSQTAAAPVNAADGWNSIDFNAPSMSYDEITGKDVAVQGNANYGIYGLGENILFDEGKATLRSDAAANLKQVVGSIDKHYKGGEVRVYGYTDSTGSASANKELAQQRADAVKSWLESNGIENSKISENAIGEARPIATNSTEAGRQQNRRVQIVARNSSAQ